MKPTDPGAFAHEWVLAWKNLDVEAVVAHFDEAARFTSPKAAETVGTATVTGKEALRAYWLARRQAIKTLRFTLDHADWDPARAELVIVYTAEINGQRTRACEFLCFGEAGRVIEGEAMYGGPA